MADRRASGEVYSRQNYTVPGQEWLGWECNSHCVRDVSERNDRSLERLREHDFSRERATQHPSLKQLGKHVITDPQPASLRSQAGRQSVALGR